MKRALVCLLGMATVRGSLAHAAPVTGVGAEIAWLTPSRGAEIDPATATLRHVSLEYPRRLPARGFLAARLGGGESAWVHVDGERANVRVALLSGDERGSAVHDVAPVERGPHDFVVRAPPGPSVWLALAAQPQHRAPEVQIWVAEPQSPGFRWELWEEAAKAWARQPDRPPPEPPSSSAPELAGKLTIVADAAALARGDAAPAAGIEWLLRAEALLLDLPAREPYFPYMRRIDLTRAAAGGRPRTRVAGEPAFDAEPATPIAFTVDGPGVVRVDAYPVFAAGPRQRESLELVLRANGRPVAVTSDETAPPRKGDGMGRASLRRLLWQAPPGEHRLELSVRGDTTRLQIYLHRRAMHAEDLSSRGEDVAHLLARARQQRGAGALASFIAGEAAFLALDDATARLHFSTLAASGASRLRAFAHLRLSAIAPDDAADQQALAGLAALGEAHDAESGRLRTALQATRLERRLAAGDHAGARRFAMLTPPVLPLAPALIGPVLRDAPGDRSSALALLDDAQLAQPLDGPLRNRLQREWWTGSRWTSLPIGAHDGAHLIDVLAPSDEAQSCADALAQHLRGYVPLPSEARIVVPGSDAAYWHRFHLLAIRASAEIASLQLSLDGTRARLPLPLATERVPLAATAGAHRLTASVDRGQVLAPCNLIGHGEGVVTEHRFALLQGRAARARMPLSEPGVDGFLGVEVRATPEVRAARFVVRSDAGVLAQLDVTGGAIDGHVLGGARLGPPVLTVLRVPGQARTLEIVRQDDGAPVYVRAMLRRGLGPTPKIEPRPPQPLSGEPDPAQVARLRAATRALRAAQSASEWARARLERGRLLLELDELAAARSDLEAALPALEVADAERARALLAALHEPPLVAATPGVSGFVLAAGAGLRASASAIACANRALHLAGALAQAEAAEACPAALGPFVAARLFESAGAPARAQAAYAEAWRREPHAALAREAALRGAEAGTASATGTRTTAFALAAVALRDGDPDARRALAHLGASSHWRTISSVDSGAVVQVETPPRAPSLKAALADLGWPAGSFHELRSGRANEIALDLERPLQVVLEAACDVDGQLADEGARCPMRVEIDGVLQRSTAIAPGQPLRLGPFTVPAGRHRLSAALEHHNAVGATLFLQARTSRALTPDSPRATDGMYIVPAGAPRSRRFRASTEAPVRLRVQGPTVLRVQTLSGSTPSATLAVEITPSGAAVDRHTQPLCTEPTHESGTCRSTVLVPLVDERTYDVELRPTSAPVILALAVREELAPAPVAEELPSRTAPLALAEQPLPAAPAEPSLLALPPPQPNWQRDIGALQVQELAVLGGASARDPRIADHFYETAVFYRRKLDHLPIWLLGAAFVRLRSAPDGGLGPVSGGGELFWFTRIPPIRLRWLADLRVFIQELAGAQHVSVALETYLERSFEVAPRFYLLPRLAFVADYQSLDLPPMTARGAAQPTSVQIDPQVWNEFDARHRLGLYGQLLLWWVPFVNMITYAEGRVNSSESVDAIDRVSVRAGFDLAFHTTELAAYYGLTQWFAGSARQLDRLEHRLGFELNQSLWLHRSHRLVARGGGFVDPVALSPTLFFGLFWEGSFGRGLDDYSTPEINLPQQLGRGRGILAPERRL